MTKKKNNGFEQASRFTQSVIDELGSSDFPHTFTRDLKETYEFYLDDAERQKLASMGRFSRSVCSTWYLMRGLFLKLTPVRRMFLIGSVLLVWLGLTDEPLQVIGGFALLLFVLGLELKDKLLAKDELEAGRAVQLALVPSTLPQLTGWEFWLHSEPANDVGGDLVDHMHLVGAGNKDRVLLTLGDVAGKGLPAALMAARLQATIRAIAPGTEDLAGFARELNGIVCRDGLPSKFASMVHVELQDDTSRVRIVNAGHLPPLLVRDGACVELDRGGPAIGLSPKAEYTSTEVTMERDDLLVVFSDGVTEARNEIGRFYGDERTYDLVKHTHGMHADALGARILRSVQDFIRTARRSDDLSLIIIRRTA
ncbi:MAG: PP2C family protein-serine/threonine phosphatase [Rhodothermales bacterium]